MICDTKSDTATAFAKSISDVLCRYIKKARGTILTVARYIYFIDVAFQITSDVQSLVPKS